METTSKKIITYKFLTEIEKNHPNIGEKERHRLANLLGNVAYEMLFESNKGIAEAYSTSILELEQFRTKFKEHINIVEISSQKMLTSFKDNAFVKVQDDKKTGQKILVSRTSMVSEMVVFLNKLNDSVMDFYKNVYKIKDSADMQTMGIVQTSLF